MNILYQGRQPKNLHGFRDSKTDPTQLTTVIPVKTRDEVVEFFHNRFISENEDL